MASEDTENLWRWLSHSENSIFIQDGLNNLKDLLVPSPEEMPPGESLETTHKSGGESIEKLAKIIKDIVQRTNHKAHKTLFDYRMQALNGLWKAKKTAQVIMDEVLEERTKRALKECQKESQISSGPVNVASELTLLMLFPLIESQTRLDKDLRSNITKLLTDFFANSPPMSIKGPKAQLDKIENLLFKWVVEDSNEDAAHCLVTLGCARDSVETLIKIINVLMQTNIKVDHLSNVLQNVLTLDYEDRQPQVLDVHYHVCGFHYNAKRPMGPEESSKTCECSSSVSRSIMQSNGFLYASNDTGCYLAKIGSGYESTLPGHVYVRSKSCLEPGFFTLVTGKLLHRPISYDKEAEDSEKFGFTLNNDTLERETDLELSPDLCFKRGEVKTIGLLSHSNQILWLRQVSADNEMLSILPQAHVTVLDFCCVSTSNKVEIVKRKILLKNPESFDNLSKMMKLLTTEKEGTSEEQVKFPADSMSSSCGLRMTTLQESALTVCDRFLTVMAPNPDCRAKSSKLLGTAYSFCLENGVLNSQHDVTVELGLVPPSLPKGFSTNSSGILYCPDEHKFWTVTYNRFDEFEGTPGLEPGACLKKRLCRESKNTDVIGQLLEHASVLSLQSDFDLGPDAAKELLTSMEAFLAERKPEFCIMALNILINSRTDPSKIPPEMTSILDQMLDFVDCDQRVIKEVINLRLRIFSNESSFHEQIGKLMQVNLNENVSSFLRQLYLKKMTFESPKKFDLCLPEWCLFVQCFAEELKLNVQNTKCLLKQDELKIDVGRNIQTDDLIETVCLVGQWTCQNKDYLPLFEELCKMSCKLSIELTEYLCNSDLTSSVIQKLDVILARSILSPTFVGSLNCFAFKACINRSIVVNEMLNLFVNVSKLLELVQSSHSKPIKMESLLPWLFTKTIESPHPVKDGYKFQETIKLPGAKCLLLVFSEKCSTLTDMDKFCVYSGGSMQGKKVLECSGSTRTIRKIGQKPWPKKPVLVFGDTITIDFEVRNRQDSDQESTSSWGFQVAVGHCPSDIFEPSHCSVLENYLLTVAPILTREISILFNGLPATPEEDQCRKLLSSKILQRCRWKESKVEHLLQSFEAKPSEEILPPLSLISSKTIGKLRNLSGIGLPIMRESTKKLIMPHLLEEAIVSVVIKHMCLEDTLTSFLQDEDPNTPDGCLLSDIIIDVYMKISSLIRRLQAVAELENKWNNEVRSYKEGVVNKKEFFFNDYVHHEGRTRDLALLCFLKHVKHQHPQKALVALRDILEYEASIADAKESELCQTKILVKGIFCRLDLLLRVDTDETEGSKSPAMMSMSLQHWPQANKTMKRQNSTEFEKTLDDSILQISRLRRSMSKLKHSRSVMESSSTPLDLQANPETIVQDLFSFIGCKPEDSVPGPVFLKAILARLRRCSEKSEAIKYMRESLKPLKSLPLLQRMICSSFADLVSTGLHSSDLYCNQKISNGVIEEFTDCLEDIVNITSLKPEDHHASIALICSLPFEKAEELSLVRCGLFKVLDDLTAASEVLSHDSTKNKLMSDTAWCGFKLLAKRCVTWEQDSTSTGRSVSHMEKQISKILANHLNQAAKCGHKSMSVEAVQEALVLLKDLASTNLGKGILSQPTCISSLLFFLMDENLSPHLIHTVIQLLQIALPVASSHDLAEIKLTNLKGACNEVQIYSLFFKRLGNLVSPWTVDQLNESGETCQDNEILDNMAQSAESDGSIQAILLHKRPDQSGHEIIQQLLNASSDIGIFSAMGSDSMEKVIKIDKDINQKNCAEVMSGDATRILRVANKMAQLGFVISIAAPNQYHDNSSSWKHRAIQICLERNNAVARMSPTRPFISSTVANKLATEMIVLIQRLLTSGNAANWHKAIRQVMMESLLMLPQYFANLQDVLKNKSADFKFFKIGQSILAAVTTLGGFYETLKPGSNVKLKEVADSTYSDSMVKHIIKDQNSALIAATLNDDSYELRVPLHRIEHEDSINMSSLKLLVDVAIDQIKILQSILLPDDAGVEPLCLPLPISTKNKALGAIYRQVSEIRTRACHILALHSKDEMFSQQFLQQSCQSLDMLKYFAKEVQPSDKLCCTEYLCENIRGKFKDQTKPCQTSQPLKQSTNVSSNNWNTMQVFPPLKSVIFTHNLTGVAYQGTPITTIGLPRGALLQAVHGLQGTASQFTTAIQSLGEGLDDSGAPTISIGLSPPGQRKEGAWNHSEGAILLHSNGRIVHYKGSNLLSWRSIRVDHLLSPGDEVTVKWNQNQDQNGSVSFEVNGNPIYEEINDIPSGMLPTLHIQQKGVRTKTTFDSLQGHPAITTEDTVDTYDEREENDTSVGAGHRRQQFQLSRQAVRSKALNSYGANSSGFRLNVNGYAKLQTGSKPIVLQDDEWLDEEDDEDLDELVDDRSDDLNSLLVKSWEDRVFPSIRRRFRNESERRDGLEQIKGALSLGMIDIAKQTVEFLYEENGGVPSDLKLPDIDDVKKDLLTLSIEKLRPGMIVDIVDHELQPLFACKQQIKTFGLEGEVIQTDIPNELVEVETYIEEDGTVVRYWYPVDYLKKSSNERQVAKSKQPISSAAQSELFNVEFILSRLYCREAYYNLIAWANNPLFSLAPSSSYVTQESHATLMSNVLLLQEWDIENLIHVVIRSTLPCHESFSDINSELSNPQSSLWRVKPKITQLLLHGNYDSVMSQFQAILHKLSMDNSQLLKDILAEVLSSLRDFEVSIPHEELQINDISMLQTTVFFPSVCCTVASMKFDSGKMLQHPDALKVVVQPLEFAGKHKSMQHSLNQCIRFPKALKGGKHWHLRGFSPMIFSSNVAKICHSGANDANVCLQIDGIPDKLFLALVLVDLMTANYDALMYDSIFKEALELMASLILKYDVVPPIKVSMFYSCSALAETMMKKGIKCHSQSVQKLLESLTTELGQQIESETKASGIDLFSSYTQAIAELCYQLHPLAMELSLDSPKRLMNLKSCLSLVTSTKTKQKPDPKDFHCLPQYDLVPYATRYVILMKIPKMMSEPDVSSSLSRSLTGFPGMKVTELWFQPDKNSAVVQLQSSVSQNEALEIIMKIEAFNRTSSLDVHEETGTVSPFMAKPISASLHCSDPEGHDVWLEFIKSKLLSNQTLGDKTQNALKKIFTSTKKDTVKFADLLMKKSHGFLAFLNGIKNRPPTDVRDDLKQFFVKSGPSEKLELTSLTDLVLELVEEDPVSVLRGFQYCGYDINMDLMGTLSQAEKEFSLWSLEEDVALVNHLNANCMKFNQSYEDIHHEEFNWCGSEMTAASKSSLVGKSDEEIRSRISYLKSLNTVMAKEIVPLANFDAHQGVSKELQGMKNILFSSWKFTMLDEIINATAEKNEDQPSIVITVNPIDNLIKESETLHSTWFYQSFLTVSEHSSCQLCCQIPHSDDPQFPLTIKMTGEEVQGNSGSFRQFLSRIIEEVHGSTLQLLMPYMGSGPYKGMFHLLPGHMTILAEKMLIYFGQIIAVALRSGVPLPIGMMPHFWQLLTDDQPLSDAYIAAFDPDLHRYIHEMESIASKEAFDVFLEHNDYPCFVWQSVTGEEVELVDGGRTIELEFRNCQDYIQELKAFRRKEIECSERMNCIKAGMATLLPMGLIRGIFTWEELQLKVCGSDEIDLYLLKKCTMYQVGIGEEDRHIQDFWSVLHSLNSTQLKTFIRFACNQERIPRPKDLSNLPPPYPMKIAPADSREEVQDKLLIRAETCIFMVKIPRYTTYDIMREKILYSIQSAEDPLSG